MAEPDDESDTAWEVVSDLAQGLGGLGGTLMAGPAGGVGGSVVVGGVCALAQRSAQKAQERRLVMLNSEVERAVAENPDMAAVLVKDDPEIQQVWLGMYRAILFATDDAAIRPLVRLTCQYLGRKRDHFFIGASRFLEESGAETIAALGRLLAAASLAPETTRVRLQVVDETDGRVGVTYLQSSNAWVDDHHKHTVGPDWEPVFLGLKRYGLATDGSPGTFGGGSGAGILLIRPQVVSKLRELVPEHGPTDRQSDP